MGSNLQLNDQIEEYFIIPEFNWIPDNYKLIKSNFFFLLCKLSKDTVALFIKRLILLSIFAFLKKLIATSEVSLFLSKAVNLLFSSIAKPIVKALKPVNVPISKIFLGLIILTIKCKKWH